MSPKTAEEGVEKAPWALCEPIERAAAIASSLCDPGPDERKEAAKTAWASAVKSGADPFCACVAALLDGVDRESAGWIASACFGSVAKRGASLSVSGGRLEHRDTSKMNAELLTARSAVLATKRRERR